MLSAWAKVVVVFGLCLSLVAAPCKNCQPQPQTQQEHCGHDCCPKPKPASQPCSWQPADYDAIEKSKDTLCTPLLAEAPAARPAALTPTLSSQDFNPALNPSPPPGNPSILVLRI